MKLSIAGVVYDAADLDLVTVKDMLMLEVETTAMGRPFNWNEVEQISARIEALPKGQQDSDPGLIWLTAVTIWASRRAKGEDVTFSQAVDFPMRDLVIIPDPEDRKAPVNPTKAAAKGSGVAGRRRPVGLAADSGTNSATTLEAVSETA